jgi:hypothetical protein
MVGLGPGPDLCQPFVFLETYQIQTMVMKRKMVAFGYDGINGRMMETMEIMELSYD